MPGDTPKIPSNRNAKNRTGWENDGADFANEAVPGNWLSRRGLGFAQSKVKQIKVPHPTPISNLLGKYLKQTSALSGRLGVAMAGIFAGTQNAFAQQENQTGGNLLSGMEQMFPFDHSAVLALAIFGGAVSFSLLSAFWLIRERARISEENNKLRKNYSGMRLERDRMASLLEVEDFSVLVWNGDAEAPQLLGSLKQGSGFPDTALEVLALGKWLTPSCAMKAEAAIADLRSEGQPFTLEITTLAGTALEAQGRVSGGLAFVRMIQLDETRGKLAELARGHEQLMDRFSVIEELFDSLPSPLWIRGHDGALAYVNPAYAAAVECDNADLAVSENRELFDAKERKLVDEGLEADRAFGAELPAVIAGDRKLMEVQVATNDAGSAGIAIDRSDVDAVRAELKYFIASQEQTFDHLASGVAIFDSQQRLQFFNSSFQQLWGLSQSDLEGQPSNGDLFETMRAQSLLPEMPDWKKWRDAQLEVYQSTETRSEHWHLPDGRTLRVIVNPQKQGGTSWVFENVTEELALRSNYNSLMRVQGETLDHLNEAVAVFGSNGKVRLTNPAFLELWNFENQEAVEGHHVRNVSEQIADNLKDPTDWENICLGVTGVDESRADLVGRTDMKDGTVLDYHLVHLPEGQSMLTLADVTASVNIERALQDRNDALEESDALKTRFIQHVSYELRAPLTSIAGFAEILTSGVPGELNTKQSEYLDYITHSSDVLKSLIDDILDLASIDAGAMQLDHELIDLDDIIEECRDGVVDKLERFGIKLEAKIAKDADGFLADPDRIRQIVYNLLSNAVGVSPDGGTVKVEASRNGNMIELSVADEGPGVAIENRETVFARFESGAGGERRRGAGLGLSIVKSFVELHGGNVWVDDNTEKGARFVCSFPLEPAANLQAAE